MEELDDDVCTVGVSVDARAESERPPGPTNAFECDGHPSSILAW